MSQLISYISLTVMPFSNNSYHRYINIENHYTSMISFSNCRFIKANVLGVSANYDTLRELNYGYYQNFENGRKFYFFIADVEYVNDNLCYVYIKDDWFSTYSNEVLSSLTKSNIIRQHSTDETYPRTVEYNPVLPSVDSFKLSKSLTWGTSVIVALNRYIPTQTDISKLIGDTNDVYFDTIGVGKHCGDVTYRLLKSNINDVQTLIKNAIAWGYSDSIFGVYAVPDEFISASSTSTEIVKFNNVVRDGVPELIKAENWEFLNFTNGIIPIYNTATSLSFSNDIKTIYTAKYEKCYDSQYFSVIAKIVDNVAEYDYMLFENIENIGFNIYCSLNDNAMLYIVPYNFDGVKGDNWDTSTLSVGLMGKCDINTDNTAQALNNAFHNFNINWTNQLNSILCSLIPDIKLTHNNEDSDKKSNTVLSLGSNLQTLGSNVINSENMYHSNRKGFTKTLGSSNSNVYQYPDNDIHFGTRHLQIEDLKRLDRYFSMYGYLYNTLMKPNLRETYSYVQGDINFYTPIPTVATNYIKSLFSSGLTLWGTTPMYEYDVD